MSPAAPSPGATSAPPDLLRRSARRPLRPGRRRTLLRATTELLGALAWGFALLSPLGCHGALLEGDEAAEGSRDDDDDPNAPGGGSCLPRIEQALILLDELAFVSSLRDLLGPAAIEGRLAPDVYTKTFARKGYVANTSVVSTRLEWALHVTRDLPQEAAEVTGCDGTDAACVRAYLEDFAHRAFRRPVLAEELDDLMEVYAQGAESSFGDGVQLAVQAVIVSPSFNHRTEYGSPRDDGFYELTPHELASSLSYLLTDSLPDPELLAAADSGALADPEERVLQVRRLLERSEVRGSVEKTLLAAWTLGNLFGKVKDPGLYPEFSAALASQMYRETELFLETHLWGDEGLSSLLTARTSPMNAALADLVGVPFPGSDPTEFVEVPLPPERIGLLTQPSVLATLSRTDSTSVVARGLFVNGPLLCLPKIPSPPEDAIAEIEAQLEHDMTERERADARATTTPCNNCHNQFDGFGLLFETYDAIGRYRTTEKGVPIDASVDFSSHATFDGQYADVVEFAEDIAERPEFVQCVTRHLLVYGTGEESLGRDACEVQQASDGLTGQSNLADVLEAIARSPALSLRKEDSAP